MTRPPFQYDQPVFVRNPKGLLMSGKRYEKGDHVPWKERGLPKANIERLYNEHHLHHNDELAAATLDVKVGDGLDLMTVEELHILVDNINVKVKAKVPKEDYDRKKCRISKIKDKQCGMIRSWRRNYGDLEAG